MLNVGGRLVVGRLLRTSPEIAARYKRSVVRTGDIVFSLRGNIGETSIVPPELDGANLTQGTARISLRHEYVNEYVRSALEEHSVRKHIDAVAKGSTFREITIEDLRKVRIALAPQHEQGRIAEMRIEWDRAIEEVGRLVEGKLMRKRGLMQQLLTGRTRFKEFVKGSGKVKTRYGDFPKDWSQVHMGDIADEVGVKNGGGHALPVLSCTKHRGLVNSLEYFGKQMFSADTSTYKVVRRGDFAYATNHVEEGSIGYQGLHDAALISPMYTVFRTRAGVDHSFFFKLVKTELYRHIFEVNTSGSIARRGGLRWDEFALIKVFLPTLPEQERIAAVLETCDREIVLLEKQLVALKEQKRGLMQKLLTGEVRVKV